MKIKLRWLLLFAAVLLILAGCQNRGEILSPDYQADGDTTGAGNGARTDADGANASSDGNSAVDPGRIAQIADDGHQPSGEITALRLADRNKGWIGGDGWIARTDNRGKDWKIQHEGEGTVNQLFALNDRQAWATIRTNGQMTGGSLELLHTADGGSNWRAAGEVPNDGFLHFVTEQEGLSGRAHTTDGGATWSSLPVPDGIAGDAYFNNSSYGWAVTNGNGKINVMRTVDGGKTWKEMLSRDLVAELTGTVIRSGGKEDVWIELVGDSGMTQTSYSLFHSSDGGKTWTTVINNSTAGAGPAPGIPADDPSGSRNEGSGPGLLYVVDKQTAYMSGVCHACDNPNTIGWTHDGGKTWHNSKQSLTGVGPQQLGFADANYGWWAISDHDNPTLLYITEDGGDTWKAASLFEPVKTSQ
ncbi:WD40/YVTN/BNR-like repeat-containing protein [Paenibacillus sp. GCM10012307]|uniref:Photosynthesis system II assembly factor Ycf48/Hcf136-like domain-containing protein n=1 Tax=Paenibacillus roseus TaxID=2798579 RepID=A0A934JBS8_9BACL|nr:hypothetical protein [Paenibacillus roseus]MBJ6363913.1 hypothetical protein [Paenibacillus roseus]